MEKVRIKIGPIELVALLRETPTAKMILSALPLQSTVKTWGDEVYFEVPVGAALESDARDVVEPGELAFWVEGRCIAIGFGPTPISRGNEIRLAAKTNIWADAIDDVLLLKTVRPGDPILIESLVSD